MEIQCCYSCREPIKKGQLIALKDRPGSMDTKDEEDAAAAPTGAPVFKTPNCTGRKR